jgi:hypothetical protein
VIVREKLETEAGSPQLLTAMIKRTKGFNPAANDWEFLVISGDAKKIKQREKTGACQSCHESVSAKDFVFDNYLQSATVSRPEGIFRPTLFELVDGAQARPIVRLDLGH